jgi:hypothetical protein
MTTQTINVRIGTNGNVQRPIVSSRRLAELARQIQTVRSEFSAAICPTPFMLMTIEERGQIWNYQTGIAEDPDPCDTAPAEDIGEPIPLPRRGHIVDGRTRVPIIGTLSARGIGIYTVKDE